MIEVMQGLRLASPGEAIRGQEYRQLKCAPARDIKATMNRYLTRIRAAYVDRRTAVLIGEWAGPVAMLYMALTWRLSRDSFETSRDLFRAVYPGVVMPETLMDHIRENWEEYRNGR